MSRHALVVNSGSSSIKFQLVDPSRDATEPPYVSGLVERIGEENGTIVLKVGGEKIEVTEPISDHADGLDKAFALMDENGCGPHSVEIAAVGHRVVHGGKLFSKPQLINDEIVEMIRDLIPLAPLHNPANIVGIEEARKLLPDVPHVAVFDTGFFHDMPPAAALYPINAEVAAEHDIRRYGFHGTSHEYVSGQVPKLLGKDAKDVNQITLHLGNGASCAAVRGGQAVDTSMGMTPLAGLMMGTRTGDIDPGLLLHLLRGGMDLASLDQLLNKGAGLKGMSGISNDMRDVRQAAAKGEAGARAALALFAYRVRKTIGAYAAAMGGLDVVVFTGGIGENDPASRAEGLAGLEFLGVQLDAAENERGATVISAAESRVKVLVVRTDEEGLIAEQALTVAATFERTAG